MKLTCITILFIWSIFLTAMSIGDEFMSITYIFKNVISLLFLISSVILLVKYIKDKRKSK
jgi:hypothetical protein